VLIKKEWTLHIVTE